MTDLSIHDLATATHGRLTLGMMPPLGGSMAPVGRLVPLGSAIQSGDVVVVTPGAMTSGNSEPLSGADPENNRTEALALTEAYALGAAGVVAEQVVCPWDGCFSLQVTNMNTSQRNLFQYVRDRTQRPVVAVLADTDRSLVVESLREQVAAAGSESIEEALSGDIMWQVLGSQASDKAIVVHVKCRPPESILQLLRPEIVVATGDAEVNDVLRTIDVADESGILVLETYKGRREGLAGKRLRDSWRQVPTAATSETVRVTMGLIDSHRKRKDEESNMTCQARVA